MKREKFLWPLTQSHHRGLVLAKSAREVAAQPGVGEGSLKAVSGKIQKVFEGELRQHFRDEEEMMVLFESRVGAKDPDAERLRADHRLLESLVPKADRESLLLFAETLTGHIRFEEDILFGRLEKAFADTEKQEWGELLQEHAPSCP